MDPRAYQYSQHIIWAAVTSFLVAVLFFQVAGSIECYSCLEEDDDGCSSANTTIIQCAPPMNVCTEYFQTVMTGSFMVTRWKKGCSVGLSVGLVINTFYDPVFHYSKIQACSTDLCNNNLTNSNVTKPPYITKDPNGVECYSCASILKDQCTPVYAEKMKCTGSMKRCYEGNVTISVLDGDSPRAIYFKTCEEATICTSSTSLSGGFMKINQEGSCCSGSYCNGPPLPTTSKPTTIDHNSQPPYSSVSHFSLLIGILIAIGVL
uniref:Ly6/PLAUR domain-containing protein 3-like isoform X2 n=1 Tax=Geotrypetes seraphini TaxID=260995 RepID=A0A6P8P614_GEOSA|nr:ly6/PLAUR domain-containing protein 3-like isoform X2 [Geotrypetes seraphini]XP_033770894.1 ly6/PLAUR domain-containing protein 3-like isoform X2 [Geotrypetes seraphini]XP_033770895.1 ly6/PLAUR domain-containing protein 3-like isoform X2 [Geotrypetes seraphini]XP_033770896.1 ly6/PLAUR domain-containing protein 3-like isoform X2 [Geotrypetes seraphini]XP_033770897.1 ly6/PLAUR domain-containing protein 3-like isoform X2 [Geotrypetes seraphini]XP_033770898.1 ly6/PLAUR domain-containing protein